LARDRIVAVGLLTAKDLELLGNGFRRLYAVQEGDKFDELLERLDRLDAVPVKEKR
jgi:hypothetical protein